MNRADGASGVMLGGKREAAANAARSRHCDKRAIEHSARQSHWETGKVVLWRLSFQSGNLPFAGTGSMIQGHEVLTVLLRLFPERRRSCLLYPLADARGFFGHAFHCRKDDSNENEENTGEPYDADHADRMRRCFIRYTG